MAGTCGQLQWVESRGESVAQSQVLPAERPHEASQSAILVEHDLGDALAREHRNEESDQHGLARTGRTADESVAGVASAIAVRRIAGVQRKVIRRMRAGRESSASASPQ